LTGLSDQLEPKDVYTVLTYPHLHIDMPISSCTPIRSDTDLGQFADRSLIKIE